MKRMATVVLSITFIFLSFELAHGYQLRGVVSDQSSRPLSGVTVYVQNSTHGVVTNKKGEYFIELGNGSYVLVYSRIGYLSELIDVQVKGSDVVMDVSLVEAVIELEPVNISSDNEDPSYRIIRNAVDAKKRYYSQFESSKCTTYIKATLDHSHTFQDLDSISFQGASMDYSSLKNLEFTESLSEVYFKAKNTYKEVRFAYQDYKQEHYLDFGNSAEIGLTSPLQEDYAPPLSSSGRDNLFYDDVTDADFNFYQNLVNLPELYEKPFISPLATSTFLTYDFKLVESFNEDGFLVHKIAVTPKRKYGAFFSGNIYIVDGLWCIKAVDFEVDRHALATFVSFRAFINFKQIGGGYWVVEREEFFYEYNMEGYFLLGQTVAIHTGYEIDLEFEKGTFSGALSVTTQESQGKNAEFWKSRRPITLKPNEVVYLRTQDSILAHHSSPDYILSTDSSYNATNIWNFLFTGVGRRNSLKGYQYYFDPLIWQLQPFAVGGYRHAIMGSYSKVSQETGKRLGVQGEASFGFLNDDFRGAGAVSYEFNPLKFAEVEVEGGSIYERVNTYESIVATFSRSNYILTEFLGFRYKRELFNGFFSSLGLQYSDQKSLEEYELASWSNSLFGELNIPQSFEQYTKLVLDARFTIRFRQKYYLKGNRRLILGSDYPQLRIRYKAGIPNVLGSDVSFQFLELQVFDDFKLGSMGQSRYNLYAGTFIRPRGTRFIDYKFFRGSDRFYYSNPVYSFQLLGPSINTSEPYFQGHYIHHFNGVLMDKIPVFNRMRLRAVMGASSLAVLSNEFLHAEAYVGLTRAFRMGEEQFRIGVYYVEASSNAQNFERSSTFKVGIDFYNPFNNSWTY